MPDESSKSHNKKKNDPKEQRRPRQRHQQVEKRGEKKTEESKSATKGIDNNVPQKPVYESPPPEFFKSLKRETDEILKITEEESTKYKKKEIQSNWTKYEMPIESYDEIEEQENVGADYEKLIQAPLSVGGYFQFKHEKSWDVNTSPSVYDKYFDINMEDLNQALCTIPFHERNDIELSIFTQTDILTMNNRTVRFKQKYFKDNSFVTPETEAQDKILNILRENERNYDSNEKNTDIEINTTIKVQRNDTVKHEKLNESDANLQPESLSTESNLNQVKKDIIEEKLSNTASIIELKEKDTNSKENSSDEYGSPILKTKEADVTEQLNGSYKENIENVDFIFDDSKDKIIEEHEIKFPKVPETSVTPDSKASIPPKETKKHVIESPEDLEKWLDDFLDN